MQFILTGFKQDTVFRVFAFERTAVDRIKVEYTVRADLALTRRYGIQMQDLPLLCRGMLERLGEQNEERSITFTEEEMRLYAKTCTDARNAAILKRKAIRRPPANNQTGIGWRATQQPR